MKNFIAGIVAWLIITIPGNALIYCAAVIAAWDLNPGNWYWPIRVGAALISLGWTALTALALVLSTEN